ncbi:MAG TPA: hypothetical protein VFP15_11390, partial [Gemmatimonadaceae bacterium]|nr:hypothetical protein [Gemmatimonadaceae bacterium]
MRSSILVATTAVVVAAASLPAAAQSAGEWPAYGRDAGGTRFSPLTQVTRDNVRQLAPAWTYHTGELARSDDRTRFEATPIMVDGTL